LAERHTSDQMESQSIPMRSFSASGTDARECQRTMARVFQRRAPDQVAKA
jgi:hypothetical protein